MRGASYSFRRLSDCGCGVCLSCCAEQAAQSRVSSPFVDLYDYGLRPDGDYKAAYDRAVAELGPQGAEIWASPGRYMLDQTLDIADGTNTSIATMCGLQLRGQAGGVSAGEFGAPRYGVELFWEGAAGGTMVRMNGPMHSSGMSGFLLDCAGVADVSLEAVHLYNSNIDIQVTGYRAKGAYLRTIDAALFSGITQGMMENEFNILAMSPALDTAVGCHAKGSEAHNVGFSRNSFGRSKFAIGGATAAAAGLVLEFVDNNDFLGILTYYGTGSTAGKGVYLVPCVSQPLFPHENTFVAQAIVGGFGGTSGTGGNLVIGYATSDGEPVPTDPNIVFLTHTGLFANLDVVYMRNGTAGRPSYTFGSDQDTGIYRIGPDTLGISSGGVNMASFSGGGSGSAQFTTQRIRLADIAPAFELFETDAAANAKDWRIESTAGNLSIDTWTDAGVFGANALIITRSGAAISSFNVLSPDIQANGQSVFDSAGIGLQRSYTVATVPSAAAHGRGLIYVSDGTANKRLGVSDGTNWRFPDGNIVS